MDDVDQFVVDARDRRVVEVADDDRLRHVVLVGVGDDVPRRQDLVVAQVAVPQRGLGVAEVGGHRLDQVVVGAVGRPVVGRGVHAEGVPDELVGVPQLVGDPAAGQLRQVRVDPGVVAQLDLARLHQRQQQVAVVGPRRVHAGDEHREADAGVLRQLAVRPHHAGVDAVVEGERQQIAGAGQGAEHAAAGKRDPRLRWRGGQQLGPRGRRRQSDRRRGAGTCAAWLDAPAPQRTRAMPRRRCDDAHEHVAPGQHRPIRHSGHIGHVQQGNCRVTDNRGSWA